MGTVSRRLLIPFRLRPGIHHEGNELHMRILLPVDGDQGRTRDGCVFSNTLAQIGQGAPELRHLRAQLLQLLLHAERKHAWRCLYACVQVESEQ
eukprot:8834057-Pyramimonas_sp.AAC.2